MSAPDPTAGRGVPDLLAALQRSVDAAKADRRKATTDPAAGEQHDRAAHTAADSFWHADGCARCQREHPAEMNARRIVTTCADCGPVTAEHVAAHDAHHAAEPDAGDVEALTARQALAHVADRLDEHSYDELSTAIENDEERLDAVRRKAGDERAEQIAQAIEWDQWMGSQHREHAARIARESR